MKSKSMKNLIGLYGEDRVKNIENDLFSLLGFVNSLRVARRRNSVIYCRVVDYE